MEDSRAAIENFRLEPIEHVTDPKAFAFQGQHRIVLRKNGSATHKQGKYIGKTKVRSINLLFSELHLIYLSISMHK